MIQVKDQLGRVFYLEPICHGGRDRGYSCRVQDRVARIVTRKEPIFRGRGGKAKSVAEAKEWIAKFGHECEARGEELFVEEGHNERRDAPT